MNAANGALLSAVLLLASCSFQTFDRTSCTQNADCADLGGVCVANGFCGEPDTVEPQGDPCDTHAVCGLTESDGRFEGDSLCVAGFCQQVLFTEGQAGCRTMFGGITADPSDTIVIPAVISSSGSLAGANNLTSANGYEVAVEVANSSGALGDRKVLVVLCDDNSISSSSQLVTETIVARTRSLSLLGPTGPGIVNEVVPAILDQTDLLVFAHGIGLRYGNLPDMDRAFRTFPSEEPSIAGFVALVKRYGADRVAILFNGDDEDSLVMGMETVSAMRRSGATVTSTMYRASQPDTYRADVRPVAAASNDPADFLIVLGGTEAAEVVSAYRDEVPNGFENGVPRILLNVGAGIRGGQVIDLDPRLTPENVELVTGGGLPTEAFAGLYMDIIGSSASGPEVAIYYDAMMMTILSYVAAPDATTGSELRDALRNKVTAPAGELIAGGGGRIPIGNGASMLSRGVPIQYQLALGGQAAVFNNKGDVQYPTFTFSFTGEDTSTAFFRRLFLGFTWVDGCSEVSGTMAPFEVTQIAPGEPCATPWNDADGAPEQSCTPPMRGAPPLCLPLCDLAMQCPAEQGLVCGGAAANNLCVPPA